MSCVVSREDICAPCPLGWPPAQICRQEEVWDGCEEVRAPRPLGRPPAQICRQEGVWDSCEDVRAPRPLGRSPAQICRQEEVWDGCVQLGQSDQCVQLAVKLVWAVPPDFLCPDAFAGLATSDFEVRVSIQDSNLRLSVITSEFGRRFLWM